MIALSNKDGHLLLDEDCGFTVTSWQFKGMERLVFERGRVESGKTSGIPILFPTPNRTKEGTFTFEGKIYQSYMHGCARFEKFEVLEQTETSCKGILKSRKGNRMYETFPFLFTLTLEIILGKKGITWNFEIENQDDKNMPFGIAIHPYIKKLGSSYLRCSAEYVMENDKDLCPLGALGPSDIQQLVDVEEKNLDLVYFSKEHAVTTEFITGETQYRLFGSEGFHHTVIYTPKGEPFVCIEPQSCSTDFINLFARGFQQVSGFQFITAGEKKKGLIVIEADQIDKQ